MVRLQALRLVVARGLQKFAIVDAAVASRVRFRRDNRVAHLLRGRRLVPSFSRGILEAIQVRCLQHGECITLFMPGSEG